MTRLKFFVTLNIVWVYLYVKYKLPLTAVAAKTLCHYSLAKNHESNLGDRALMMTQFFYFLFPPWLRGLCFW